MNIAGQLWRGPTERAFRTSEDSGNMDHAELVAWLKEDDAGRLATLWQRADAARREHVGAQVHLRGLIEFTNHCQRHCLYCGLRFPQPGAGSLPHDGGRDSRVRLHGGPLRLRNRGTAIGRGHRDRNGLGLRFDSAYQARDITRRHLRVGRAQCGGLARGMQPGPIAICCDSRPRTWSCFTSCIRRVPERLPRIGSACCARCGRLDTRLEAA